MSDQSMNDIETQTNNRMKTAFGQVMEEEAEALAQIQPLIICITNATSDFGTFRSPLWTFSVDEVLHYG